LDALDKYERTIQTSRGNGINSLTRQAATKWRVYQLQKGVELLELVSEDNTDSNESETVEAADLDLDVEAYVVDRPLVPLPDSPGTSADYWRGDYSDQNLGMDFTLGSTFPYWPSSS
jgi:hypothetical protein